LGRVNGTRETVAQPAQISGQLGPCAQSADQPRPGRLAKQDLAATVFRPGHQCPAEMADRRLRGTVALDEPGAATERIDAQRPGYAERGAHQPTIIVEAHHADPLHPEAEDALVVGAVPVEGQQAELLPVPKDPPRLREDRLADRVAAEEIHSTIEFRQP